MKRHRHPCAVALTMLLAARSAWADDPAPAPPAPAPMAPASATPAPSTAQADLSPSYPSLSVGGSAGLPWYTNGAALALPFRFGGDNALDESSAEVRYALEEYGAAIAVEKGSVTMLAGAEGMAPVAAPLAQITVRRAFGAYTRQLEELQCARLGEVIDGPVPCAHKAPHDRIEQGDYVVPYGRSYAIGARVGALTLDEQVGAVATVEAVVEHACPGGAIFGSLVVDFIANLQTPVQRYHGGQGARLVLGGHVGHFKRVGLIGSIGGRRWVAGKEDEFDYSAEVMLFGAWDNIRIGAGIVRSLNAKAGVDAGTQDGQFVPTLWLSPQI